MGWLAELLFGVKQDDKPIDKSKPVSWWLAETDKEYIDRLEETKRKKSEGQGWSW